MNNELRIAAFALAASASLAFPCSALAQQQPSTIGQVWDLTPQMPGDWDTTVVNGDMRMGINGEKRRPPTPNQVLRKEAHSLAVQKQYAESLKKLDALEVLPGKQNEDINFIHRSRLAIAHLTDNKALLVSSIEATLTGNFATPEEKALFPRVLASRYYSDKDYKKAIYWGKQALQQSPAPDADIQKLIANSHYLLKDYAASTDALKTLVSLNESRRQRPSEEVLRMLVDSSAKAGDKQSHMQAIEKLASYYGDKGQWAELLNNVVSRPDFSDRLGMDVFRLMYATEQISTEKELVDAAQQALSSGYAAFAKHVIEDGMRSGKLGTGKNAKMHAALYEKTKKAAALELKSIEREEAHLKKGGSADMLAMIGFAYADHGKTEKGIHYLQEGINSGKLKYPDEAKLHLAISYAMANQQEKAMNTLKDIQGGGGVSELARYWTLYLAQKEMRTASSTTF